MLVATRAPFEFALSEQSVLEVDAAHDPRYLRWAWDVMDHWLSFEADEADQPQTTTLLDGSAFGYLGDGDRALLADALRLRCDAFLTMENRLPKNSQHIERMTGLRILSPIEMWERLRPWARLFY